MWLAVGTRTVTFAGKMAEIGGWQATIPEAGAVEIARLAPLADDAFLHLDWTDGDAHRGENDYLPQRPKAYDLGTPQIRAVEGVDDQGRATVTLTTDRPALWVTWDHGGDRVWSDNAVTLLPGRPRVLVAERLRASHLPGAAPRLDWLKG